MAASRSSAGWIDSALDQRFLGVSPVVVLKDQRRHWLHSSDRKGSARKSVMPELRRDGPIPRSTTVLGTLPVTMNPPIMALSPNSTRKRVAMFKASAGSVPVPQLPWTLNTMCVSGKPMVRCLHRRRSVTVCRADITGGRLPLGIRADKESVAGVLSARGENFHHQFGRSGRDNDGQRHVQDRVHLVHHGDTCRGDLGPVPAGECSAIVGVEADGQWLSASIPTDSDFNTERNRRDVYWAEPVKVAMLNARQ